MFETLDRVPLCRIFGGGPGGIRTHDFGLRRPTSWSWLDYGPGEILPGPTSLIILYDVGLFGDQQWRRLKPEVMPVANIPRIPTTSNISAIASRAPWTCRRLP